MNKPKAFTICIREAFIIYKLTTKHKKWDY